MIFLYNCPISETDITLQNGYYNLYHYYQALNNCHQVLSNLQIKSY